MKNELMKSSAAIPSELMDAIQFREIGNYQQAIETLDRYTQRNSLDPIAYSILAHVSLLAGEQEKASNAIEEALRINPSEYFVKVNYARVLLKLNKLKEALDAATEAYRIAPNDAEAQLVLGAALCANNEHKKAQSVIELALTNRPNYAEAFAIRSFIRIQLGDMDGALSDAETAVSIKPFLEKLWGVIASIKLSMGNIKGAIQALERGLDFDPHNARYLLDLGELNRQVGEVPTAISFLRKLVELDKSNLVGWVSLGTALQDAGQLSDAKAAYKVALSINPNLAEAVNNLGCIERAEGNPSRATQYFRNAVAINPKFSEALGNLGVSLRAAGNLEDSETCFREAIRLNPDFTQSHNNLGWLLLEKGEIRAALASGLTALKQNPSHSTRGLIVQCLSLIQTNHFDLELAALITQALEETWSRPVQLVIFAQDFLLQDSYFSDIVEKCLIGDAPIDLLGFLKYLNSEQQFRRLFDLTLGSAPLSSVDFEIFLTKLREQLLKDVVSDGLAKAQGTGVENLLRAIARQCYINEYVYVCSEWELLVFPEIQVAVSEKLRRSEAIDENIVLILACYESLFLIPNHERLLNSTCSEALRLVLEQQIREPQAELALRSNIPRLTEINDEISLAVQSQYEENPYPRWVRAPIRLDTKTINKRIRDLFPHIDFIPFQPELCPSVLISGCGTGQQPIEVACLLKNSEVLAIDLSIASLAYAKRKALELCVNNISFAQADILKLGKLQRKFDVIASSGVLHHMRDPFEAWDVLLSLLNPNGLMKIGLYSQIARRQVAELRELIAAEGLRPNRLNISHFRRTRLQRLDLEDFGWAVRSPDFFSLSGCRDLLFHVQEHRMTLPMISDYLNKRRLKFLGFEMDHSAIRAYQGQFPDDKAAINLSNWNKFEQENPDTFQGMYQFWVQKF